MMYSRFDKFSSASEIEVISKGILHPPKTFHYPDPIHTDWVGMV